MFEQIPQDLRAKHPGNWWCPVAKKTKQDFLNLLTKKLDCATNWHFDGSFLSKFMRSGRAESRYRGDLEGVREFGVFALTRAWSWEEGKGGGYLYYNIRI